MNVKKPVTSGEVWIVGDLRNKRLYDLSLRLLSKARELAVCARVQTAMLIMGAKSEHPSDLSLDESVQEALAHGADVVYQLEHEALCPPRADLCGRLLADMVLEKSPKLVMIALTDFGRETAARAARFTNCGMIADCIDLTMEPDGAIKGTCPAWGGEIVSKITYAEGMTTGFATVQPYGFEAQKADHDPGRVVRISVSDLKIPDDIELISSEVESESSRRLEDAEVVVAGGAGLGDSEGFGLIRQLAVAVGGQVGATRPPVLSHWVDEGALIGQTGKTVRPKLLFSIGTSGAIQYTAGILESGHIVAINRDPDAPIFQTADIGIVADAKTILPMMIEAAKRAVLRKLADSITSECVIKDEDSGFGAKIRKLREGRSWTKESLAEATGQTPEFIDQVEANEISPPVGFLLRLARSLEVDPSTFLSQEAKLAIRDQRTQAYIKRTRNYSYQSLTAGAESDHLRAFMVTIDPYHDHKPVAYKHEGEEFIFVMEGVLEFTLGSKVHTLKKGASIHFNSDTPHKLKSLSQEPTRCLVILYTL
jgi:electron transfer flavoprotein alpha subunit/transcriptional regulator with XRE-family HTH domain